MPREHEDWVRQLYLAHAPDLYRAARYRLQDPELAYDLTQEVFLTLLDKQAQVKHHPNPAGWLWKTLQYKLGHAFSRQAVRAISSSKAWMNASSWAWKRISCFFNRVPSFRKG